MDFTRLVRHLLVTPATVRRALPPSSLHAIEAAIAACEATHSGQIRFVVEADLPLPRLLHGLSPRERAIEVFAAQRIWDTEHNNGVLIYLLLADRAVEIVVDRGVSRSVGRDTWEEICHAMEQAFADGKYEHGVVAGIRETARHLVDAYPSHGGRPNELPDAPLVI